LVPMRERSVSRVSGFTATASGETESPGPVHALEKR
jgi:hypothetical protein